jgi:hypothetical protein
MAINPSEARKDYYRDPRVCARIREFIGACDGEEPSCEFLAATNADAAPPFKSYPSCALNALLDGGFEICRSLWDHAGLIADFDIEYVNFDDGAEAFVHPERIFSLQQPVEETIKRLLNEYGIDALHVLSGRGHHFVWKIKQDSREFKELAELGRAPPTFLADEAKCHGPNNRPVPPGFAHAFAGLGLLMEFLAHRVKQIAAPRTKIPVELTAVEVGPREHGREMISIDISEYGDPLYSRTIRVPFSIYRKPWQQRWAVSEEILKKLKPFIVVPLQEIHWQEGIYVARHRGLTTKLAGHCSVRIPEAAHGTGRLLADYERSKLAKFHRAFYSQEQHPAERWPETYDRLPLEILPTCARTALEQPNDLLLRPAFIRRVIRVLLALGWHPRHIAGLIYSKYQRDFGWTQFVDVDPVMRADFYVRVFSGLFATGDDDLMDFNCVSAQEQQTCTSAHCGFNLADFRESALTRRAHDKLAHRPFNRLFLSSEHS